MNNSSFKICTIGCGQFAIRAHGPADRKYASLNPNTELTACCDINEARANEYRQLFGFRRHYADLSAILDKEKPDAVNVAVTPIAIHDVVAEILNRGIPVMLEKPPGLTSAELEDLIAIANRNKTPTQVGFNRRYMPIIVHAKQILETVFPPEEVKKIDYDLIRFDRREDDFSTTAIHALDTIRFIARSPYEEATISYLDDGRAKSGMVVIRIEGRFTSGTHFTINILPMAGQIWEGFSAHALGRSLNVRLLGSEGSNICGSGQYWRGDRQIEKFNDEKREWIDRYGIFHEMRAFYDGIRTGGQLDPDLTSCRQQVALMEAIRTRRTDRIKFENRSKLAMNTIMGSDVCS